jgi:tRNA threonylcarbamoyladenosine biosynthesis protein TsaE
VKLESIQCEAVDEAAMLALGAALSAALVRGSVVYLVGDLGMGKTTLARGILRALGHEGTVKSPTYTLVEPYEVDAGSVFHFDLYRLGDPEELEFIGIRDYFDGDSLALVEWPQRGAGFLPPADLVVTIGPAGNGRHLDLVAHSSLGAQCLERLSGDSAIKMRQECNE